MIFCAPRNDWNMLAPRGQNWWGMTGGVQSTSGVTVTETTAMTFSAVFAAIRIISETLASLPCNILERVDYRTTNVATDHPLYRLLHDAPTHEQDAMSWFDMQVAFQVGWGNAFAEKQFDSLGRIVALWPIHPSRIPLRNIVRNPDRPLETRPIDAGRPGELVFYVDNDDGTKTPIPASDMLHVPGVLSSNGVTGQSIIRWGANSIGNALAAEQHAGALFRNGALSNLVLTHPKTISADAANRLRQQWQSVFAGVNNHYKTLVLEDGMEPKPINMSPEASQLLASRAFSVTEIARWFRLPPHLLADLSRATHSNIEEEGLSFIVYSMLPWIVRWEKAMHRQLLTEREKEQYHFKFNVNGLLRGNLLQRSQFYTALFNLGAFSPNDIREREDLNPIEGGDQYFVQGNNAVPLDKIGEVTEAQIEQTRSSTASNVSTTAATESDDDESDATNLRLQELRVMQESLLAHVQDVPRQFATAVSTLSQQMTVVASAIDEIPDRVEYRNTAEDVLFRTESERKNEQAIAGVRIIVAAECDKMLSYEIRALRQAAKNPQSFLTWRDTFYNKFTATLAKSVEPMAAAATGYGFLFDCVGSASRHVYDSLAALEPLADVSCNDLESAVEKLISTWGNRPECLAKMLLTTTNAACAV